MILCCVPHPSFNGFAYYVIRYILLYFRHKGAAIAAFEDLCTIGADLLLGDFFRRSSVCAPLSDIVLSEYIEPPRQWRHTLIGECIEASKIFYSYKQITHLCLFLQYTLGPPSQK